MSMVATRATLPRSFAKRLGRSNGAGRLSTEANGCSPRPVYSLGIRRIAVRPQGLPLLGDAGGLVRQVQPQMVASSPLGF